MGCLSVRKGSRGPALLVNTQQEGMGTTDAFYSHVHAEISDYTVRPFPVVAFSVIHSVKSRAVLYVLPVLYSVFLQLSTHESLTNATGF